MRSFLSPLGRVTRAAASLVALVLAFGVSSGHAAPAPDPTFGDAGRVRIGVPAGFEDVVHASAIQPDGKVVVAGISDGRQRYDFVTRFTADGQPDPTFFNGGTWRIDGCVGAKTTLQVEALGDGSLWLLASISNRLVVTRIDASGGTDIFSCDGSAYAFIDPAAERGAARMTIQPDGKQLFVTDASAGGAFALRLRRFGAGYGGPIDISFGPDGERLLTGLPADFAFTSTQLAVAEPDGGFTLVANGTFPGSSYLVLRLTANGTLDPSFGGGAGYVSGFDLGNARDVPTQLARTPDGRYVAFGYPVDANGFQIFGKRIAWKLDALGQRVDAFGNDGVVTLPDSAVSIQGTVLADGNIAVAIGAPESRNVMIALFDAAGRQLSQFGANGVATVAVPGYLTFNPVSVHADLIGRIHVAGSGYASKILSATFLIFRGSDALVASVASNGAPRSDYGGGDGISVWNDPALSNDRLDAVRFDAQGRIVLVGYSDGLRLFDYLLTDYMLTRLTGDGAVDTTYGANGRLYSGLSARFFGFARAAMGPDESIVVASGEAAGSHGSFPSVTMFRATANGTLDLSYHPSPLPAGPHATVALGTRPDGRVVYGTIDNGSAVLQQFRPDGTPDAAFGTGGKAEFPIGTNSVVQGDLALLADESVVFAVFLNDSVRIFKVDPTGKPVPSFGMNGQLVHSAPGFQQTFIAGPVLLALADGTLLAAQRVTVRTIPGERPVEGLHLLRLSPAGAVIHSETVLQAQGYSSFVLAALPDSSVIVARNFDDGAPRALLYRLLPDGNFDQGFGVPTGYSLALTQVNGMALDLSGRLVVSGQDTRSAIVARYILTANVQSVPVVEFFNSILGHYFVTAGPGEIATIESGGAGPGWQHTGQAFGAFTPESGVAVGAYPVCRFYGAPGVGPNSHFYTVDPVECAAVKTDAGWAYEGTAFFIGAPTESQCEAGTVPVYRAYNGRFAQNDSNHRYATDGVVYNMMLTQGWSGEGVVFCAPPL